MRAAAWATVAVGLWAGAALAADAPAVMTAREILDRVDDLYRGDSSHGRILMKIVTAHWSREMSLEFWSQGRENTLIRILAPQKEKGTATLRAGHNIWNYLPKVNQVIKIPSSMMGVSWMGSHFTNDDFVKQSRMTKDFDYEETFAGVRDGTNVTEITCLPKPKAAVVWGKIVVTARRDDWAPLAVAYFDEEMKPARTLTFGEFQRVGERFLPSLARMAPADHPEEVTELRYVEVTFNPSLPPDLFTLRSLQR